MVDNLSLLPMRSDEDNLARKKPTIIYRTNKLLNGQLPSEKETMIKKCIAWINRAQLGGYFLGIVASIMCISSATTERWRIWQVVSKDGRYPGKLWVGIWKACYLHSTHPENRHIHCEDFTERMSMLPKEIFLAQDLMSLSCVVGAVSITIMTFSLWNVVKVTNHKPFLLTLFNIGGLLNFVAGIMVLIPISWNMYSILVNRNIRFPESFRMPTFPERQEIGASIYVGYSAAVAFMVSAVMVNCNKTVLQSQGENKDLAPAEDLLTATQFHTNIAASVIMSVPEKKIPEPGTKLLQPLHYTNKDSSRLVQPQLHKGTKKITISVTPYQ